MARARNIKPGFFQNELLVEFPFEVRLLFIGLWTLADKEGRLEDRPKKIKMAVFPADNVDVEAGLKTLAQAGFIVRYQAEGRNYISIPNWHKHQSPHHTEKASVIPPLNNGEEPESPQKQDGGNPPDSLIHRFSDSPIPDSSVEKTSTTTPGVEEKPAKPASSVIPSGETPPPRATAIAQLVRGREANRGKAPKLTAKDPLVQQWATSGVTDAQVIEAYALAVEQRDRDGDDKPLNAGFLDCFIAKLVNPASAKSAVGPPAVKPPCFFADADGRQCGNAVVGMVKGRHHCRAHADAAMYGLQVAA